MLLSLSMLHRRLRWLQLEKSLKNLKMMKRWQEAYFRRATVYLVCWTGWQEEGGPIRVWSAQNRRSRSIGPAWPRTSGSPNKAPLCNGWVRRGELELGHLPEPYPEGDSSGERGGAGDLRPCSTNYSIYKLSVVVISSSKVIVSRDGSITWTCE